MYLKESNMLWPPEDKNQPGILVRLYFDEFLILLLAMSDILVFNMEQSNLWPSLCCFICSLRIHWFLQRGFAEQPLKACVHCALLTNSVSCKQFSNVCTVCKCFIYLNHSWEKEGTQRRRGEKVFLWVENKNKVHNFSRQWNILSILQAPYSYINGRNKRTKQHWFANRQCR